MVLVAGIEPQGRIEPKMLGAVTLGKEPPMITSPSGPVLVMAGVKAVFGWLQSSELPTFSWVWIEPPSPHRLMFSMKDLSSWLHELKVSATVMRATTAPRATLLGVTMLAVPLLLAVLTPWTSSTTLSSSNWLWPHDDGLSSMKKPTC